MKKKLAVLLSAALLALGVPVGLGVSAAAGIPGVTAMLLLNLIFY